MDKTEKVLDRLAKAMEELVKVQKEQLRIIKLEHRLAELQYENTMKTLAKYDESNAAIHEQLNKTEEEISKWENKA